jgi:hypothetical protein
LPSPEPPLQAASETRSELNKMDRIDRDILIIRTSNSLLVRIRRAIRDVDNTGG